MDNLDRNAKLLENALNKVNRKIAALAASLRVDDNGALLTDQAELTKAMNMRVEIAAIFAKEFDGVTNKVLKSFITAAKDANKELSAAIGVKSTFGRADAAIVSAMMTDTGMEITSASLLAQSQISQALYVSVIAGGKQEDLIQQVGQYLIGQTDKRGNPMLSHVDTIVRTRYMETDAIVTQKKAADVGVTKFRYTGGTVKDSREWCVNHVGKVFTREEIAAWERESWAGKKPGDPFVVRGGWNCIHRFRAVVDDVE